MTHAELVIRAGRWLRRQGCSTIITARSIMHWEQPDAIGWKSFGWSLLVECKVSRADFLRDARKAYRVYPGLGLGTQRVYMTPAGLLDVTELPPLWGLVEVDGRRAKIVVRPLDQPEKLVHAELVALLAHIRRLDGSRRERLRSRIVDEPLAP